MPNFRRKKGLHSTTFWYVQQYVKGNRKMASISVFLFPNIIFYWIHQMFSPICFINFFTNFPQFEELKMVFCFQNCADPLWEKIVPMIEKIFESRGWRQEFAKKIEITISIHSTSETERPVQFLKKNAFITCCFPTRESALCWIVLLPDHRFE